MGLTSIFLAAAFVTFHISAQNVEQGIPSVSRDVVDSLDNVSWEDIEPGFRTIRTVSSGGVVFTAHHILPEFFEFSIKTQKGSGARARDIGEALGAVLVTNAGFFAQRNSGNLYPIGYLKLDGEVLSKGWKSDGGVLTIDQKSGLELAPTHWGLPTGPKNSLQSRPMLIEPGGRWAMGSNQLVAKNRTILCKLPDGSVIIALVTRGGMSLFEAGWVMREKKDGGFFGCDSSLALDGGRSTQVWFSDDPKFSFSGSVPVHNFLVVHAKQN